ncbi:metalloproteinase inhibitor 2-like [Carassius carassius]|uniref:metalloproteinase inhibitor 2-like n=1 Tax=Carassius carassius TaxID=217509 RepID=UPI0028694339|nr:metalloproteinase inhibitor 2-like [Carassius carassius]
MSVSMSAAVTLGLLILLSARLNEQVSEGCSCLPAHPQQMFCRSEIVMRAEVTGENIHINKSNLVVGSTIIQYEIQVIKVFKGFDRIKGVQHVYTNEESSLCGTSLDRGQYLLSGIIMSDGIFLTMCDYVRLWDGLSLMEKKNFKYRYLMGCNCTISLCFEKPCQPSTKDECILTNLSSVWQLRDGGPMHDSACIRHRNGTCVWYEATSKPSENDTMDASDGQEHE